MRRFVLSLMGGMLLAGPVALGAPLLQYAFDEASGAALDTGDAPAADGTLLGGAIRSINTPSGTGSAVDFVDAPYAHVLAGDGVSEGNAAKLDGLSAVTVTTWLNLRTYTSGNNRLAAKQAAGTFGGINFSMNATPNDGAVSPDNFRLGLFIGNNVSSGAADFGAAFSNVDAGADNEWVFLAVTYDNSLASGNTTFYIGDLTSPVAMLGTAQTLPQLTIDGGGARFGVGFTDAAPTANVSANGLQDDVRVYGEALDLASLNAVRLSNIPEPASLGMLALAGAAMMGRRRRA